MIGKGARRALRKTLLALVLVLASACVDAGGAFAENPGADAEGSRQMLIQSSAFNEGETIPRKHTCDGEDVSPQLSWAVVPEGTKSLVLICDDPDAPMGTWVHWALFGIAPDVNELPEGVGGGEAAPGGPTQGRNDFGRLGYGGPCPPVGPAHRYYFTLYAVDIELVLAAGARKADVMRAIEGHILAEGRLMGRYGR